MYCLYHNNKQSLIHCVTLVFALYLLRFSLAADCAFLWLIKHMCLFIDVCPTSSCTDSFGIGAPEMSCVNRNLT